MLFLSSQGIRLVAVIVATIVLLTACNGATSEPEQTEATPPASNQFGFSFVNVTEEAGLGGFKHIIGDYGDVLFPESMGSGCGFIDYNGDGWLDILLVGGGVFPRSPQKFEYALWLYRNNGDGTFTFVSPEAGLVGIDTYGLGVTVGDYDNDGDEDFYFTTLYENMLFRNDGGVFVEVGKEAGVAGPSEWSASGIFFDADRDGDLDLFHGNYVKWTIETDKYCSLNNREKGYCTPETYEGISGRFYVNNGDGTFTERTKEAGMIPSPGKNLGVAEFDYNRDGWPDLIVTNDTQPNLLWRNNGDGTFTEIGALSGIAYDEHGKTRAGMGVDTGVIDKSGEESIVIANFSREMIAVYRYLGNDLFQDISARSRVGRISLMTLTFGLFLIDIDLDGDLDMYAANGHVQPQVEETQEGVYYAEPPHLFLNDGNGMFEDHAPDIGGPLLVPVVARGACFGDYDRDGDIDILVAENDGPVHLLRNDLVNGNNFLKIKTRGKQVNRDGYGTRIVARVGDHVMERRVRGGSSYLAHSETAVIFGLGQAEKVDTLTLYWLNGHVDTFANVQANQELLIIEGEEPIVMPRNGNNLAAN